MAWMGAVAAGASVVSGIIGMQRGDGGLGKTLAAINVQLDGLIRAQIATFEALKQIGHALASLNQQVSGVGMKVVQSEATLRTGSFCRTIADELQLIEQSAGDRHPVLVGRVANLAADLRTEIDVLHRAMQTGPFNAAPYFAATNALAIAGTTRRFLSAKQLLGPDVADHLPFIADTAAMLLEDYVAPGALLAQEILGIKAAMQRTTDGLAGSTALLCDKTLWKQSIHDFADLTDKNATRPRAWPWNLHEQEVVTVSQETKFVAPEGRYIRTARDQTYYGGGGSREGPGEGHLMGSKDEEYADRIYIFDLNTRVSSVAGRSTLFEVQRVELSTAQTSVWRYWHRTTIGHRTRGPIVWREGDDVLRYSGRDTEVYTGPRMKENEFNSMQDAVAAGLEFRNSLALLLAFYLQIREGALSTLESYRSMETA